jgi:uncharacterized membrane protein
VVGGYRRSMDITPARLASDARLDPVVDRLGRVADTVLRRPDLRRALRGEWLGHPVHPALTDLPIGFWTSAFVLDFAGRRNRRAADLLVAAGLVSVLPTAAAGLADWRERGRGERRIGVVHAASNVVATLLYAGSLGHRLRGNRLRGVVFGMAGAAAVTVGGYLGGQLAFGTPEEPADDAALTGHDALAAEPAGDGGPVDPQGAALAAMNRTA